MNIPAAFIKGYMKAHPDAKAQDIISLYKDLSDVNPGVATMSAKEIHDAVHGAVTHHLSNGGMVKKYADGGEVTAPGMQSILIRPEQLGRIDYSNRLPGVMPFTPEQLAQANAMMPLDMQMPAVAQDPVPESGETTGKRIDQNARLISPHDVRVQLPNARTQYDPYAGAGYSATDSMKQFDPAAIRAAMEQQQLLFQQNQGERGRNVQSRLLAAGMGGDQATLASANSLQDKMFETQDAQNLLATLKKQEALQSQATQGLAAGKSALDISKEQQELFSKFNDNIVKGMSTEQQQRMNDPDSPETLTAKSMLTTQLALMPPEVQDKLKVLLSGTEVTAQQLAPIMSMYAPEVWKAFTSSAGLGKTTTETAGQAIKNVNMEQQGKAYGEQSGTGVPDYGNKGTTVNPVGTNTPVTNRAERADPTKPGQEYTDKIDLNNMNKEQHDKVMGQAADLYKNKPTDSSFSKIKGALPQTSNEDLDYIANAKSSDLSPVQKLMRQRMESTDNAEIINLDKQIAKAQGNNYISPGSSPQMVMTPSGDGTFSTAVSPVSSAAMQRTGQNIQAKADSVETFNASGRPAAQNAYRFAEHSGYGKAANWSPNTNEAAAKLDLAVNRLNAESMRLGQTVAGPGSGALSTAAGAIGAISPLLGAAAGSFAALNGVQSITSKSPTEVIKQYAVATQVAAERQKLLIGRENAWSASHNGDTSGFVNSPDYKQIMNADPYINPTTGEVQIPITRTQQDSLLKTKQYGPLSKMSFRTAKPQEGGAANELTAAMMDPNLGRK